MRRAPLEADEQAAFVSWWQWRFPGVLLYAIPNGMSITRRGPAWFAQRTKRKKQGVVDGIPDLHAPEFLIWIEVKRAKGGRLSDAQRQIHEYLRGIGHTVLVCAGVSDAMRQVEAWHERRAA